MDRGQPTQVGRALAHLGVEHIAAYSPQARGRSERLFQTLQDRVPKELALAGIATMSEANAWLRDTYIPAHNARFAITAEQEGSAFVAVPGLDLAEVLCVQEERIVGNDNCVSFLNLQAPDPGEPAASALRQGDGEGASISRWGPRCFPWTPLPRTLRQQWRSNRRTSCRGPRKKGYRPVPSSASRRARGCQGRCARRGDLAFGEAIPDAPRVGARAAGRLREMVLTVPPGNARRRHRSSGGQNVNERPHDVSPKPANLICSRHRR